MRAQMVGASVVVALLVASASHAQTPAEFRQELERFRGVAIDLIRSIRPELRKGMTADERAIEDTIDYQVFTDGNLNAYARHRNGRRAVHVSAGILYGISVSSFALTAGFHIAGSGECVMAFFPYYGDGVLENSRRVRRGLPLRRVYDLVGFAAQNRDICPRITTERVTANRNADFMHRMAVRGSFKWLIAHEVAHHLEGMHGSTPAKRRVDEEAADKRALKLLVASDTNPIEASAIFTLFGALDDYPVESDPEDTHPPTGARIRPLISAGRDLLENDPAFIAHMRANGTLDAFRQAIDSLEERFE